MKKELIINVRNLSISFNDNKVLDNINLQLTNKESLVIIGKSGSGKSVLLKCLMGLLKPETGKIEIYGDDIVSASRVVREKALLNIGVTFQNGALFDSLKIWENITFKDIRSFGYDIKKLKNKALAIVQNLGLNESVLDLYPSELSGGMQKRVAIARAVYTNPKVLFFDEPTSGLDPITGKIINELIIRTVKKLGVSAITITHDISSIEKLANRIILLDEKKISWSGTPKEIKKSDKKIIKQFLNNSL